jgi:hypothetical protein
MTELTWLTSDAPRAMLGFLASRMTDRKLRLFAVACCRRVMHLLTDKHSRRAVEVAERFADGTASADELAQTREAAESSKARQGDSYQGARAVARATVAESAWDAANAASWYGQRVPELNEIVQAFLLRDITGDPFRTVKISRAWLNWRNGSVVNLAQAIYDQCPIGLVAEDGSAIECFSELADTLEMAGCSSKAVLAHCRGQGNHVRGCWVMDQLLGKE